MGFFSWIAQDTGRSINNVYSNRETFDVYMVNPVTGESWRESAYDGYGVFGGKDFFELFGELNDVGKMEAIRMSLGGAGISPILVENLESWRDYIGKAPANCPAQGFFYD